MSLTCSLERCGGFVVGDECVADDEVFFFSSFV